MNSAHAAARPGSLRRLGEVDVQVTRAGMADVLGQRALQHAHDSLDVRVRDVPRTRPRFEEEQRFGVQRRGVEVVRIRVDDLLHGVGVRAILLHPFGRIEALDVASRHGLNERALNRRGMRGRKRDGLLNRGVRERRLVRSHDPVQIRSPRPGLAPVADRAHRIAHLRFAERAHGLRLREGIGQLESLVEECLRLAVLRGNRPRERAQRGLVEADAPVERGRRSAVVRMLAGRRGGLRASAGKAETGHDRGRRRAREPTPSMPEHCLDDIARRQHRPPTGEYGLASAHSREAPGVGAGLRCRRQGSGCRIRASRARQ